jgi:hypothetical protein
LTALDGSARPRVCAGRPIAATNFLTILGLDDFRPRRTKALQRGDLGSTSGAGTAFANGPPKRKEAPMENA